MSLIPRKTALIFGSLLTPTGNVAKWGSLAAGAAGYSNDPALIQTPAWLQGLNAELIGNRSPVKEDFNGLFLVLSQQIAYLLQAGIAEWDATTDYWIDQIARGSDGNLYASKTDNNTGHDPISDSNNWGNLFDLIRGAGLAVAWVEFDGINAPGGNSVIHNSFNVSSVTKNADGNYEVVFATPLPSAHYVFSGSCGSEDGQPYGAGDDGVVVGNIAGQGNAIRSAARCRVFTINPTNKALVASGDVSVMFFCRP